MKTNRLLNLFLSIILFTAYTSTYAGSPTISPDMLIGNWYASEDHPEQGNIETYFTINADNTFSGSMTIDDVSAWQYAGTWSLAGNKITWVYVESNIILLQEDMADTDVIISVTDESLTYRSLRRDKESTLQRVR